ncbi:MAG: antirestriction protein ArdA [Pseudomonadota bacterium]
MEAASELFDDCYVYQIPENIRFYIDYEKFARDCRLGGDMDEFEFGGLIWTCTNSAGL